MISFIYDAEHFISGTSGLTLDRLEQYHDLYAEIQNFLQSPQSQGEHTVILRQGTAFQWFKDMAVRYPQGVFAFETVDADGALARSWGMEIPASVTNDFLKDVVFRLI